MSDPPRNSCAGADRLGKGRRPVKLQRRRHCRAAGV